MKKIMNKKGFTLAELLIVVAIVSVLVAISIPIFSGKLNKAKLATNQANIRAAKAAAVADYLTDGIGSDQNTDNSTPDKKYVVKYDIDKGVLNKDATTEEENGIYKVITVKIDGEDNVLTQPYYDATIDKIVDSMQTAPTQP